MDDKKYYELTEEEIAERAKLTPKEQAAVDALMAAVKALPDSLAIKVDNLEPNFTVIKRITKGSARCVASLRKKSLSF